MRSADVIPSEFRHTGAIRYSPNHINRGPVKTGFEEGFIFALI